MDDTKQNIQPTQTNPTNNTVSSPVAQTAANLVSFSPNPASQQTSPVSITPVQTPPGPPSSQPSQSYISSPSKEAGGTVLVQEKQRAEISPSHPEIQLPPEVQNAGVETVSETPIVTPGQQAVGIQPAKESVPVSTSPSGLIHLPIPEQKAQEIIKQDKDTADSKLWLATLILRELHAAALRHLQQNLTAQNTA